MLKKYSLLITLLYSAALTTISLIRIKGISEIGISFGDKFFHFFAYFVLTLFWANTFLFKFKFKVAKAIKYAVILSIAFGILIEAMQGVFTFNRFADIYDVLANTLGVLFAMSILWFKHKKPVKKA